MTGPLRVLLLADTHLGFDDPQRPRTRRVRRGPDFFANTRQALEPARRGRVDLVVHGGDLLFRSRVSAGLVMRALEPLLEVADTGVPVVLVPGNHERSAIPYPVLASHDRLHLFDRPRTIRLEIDGLAVDLVGFPCQRDRIRTTFQDLLTQAEESGPPADIRLLCLHQTVEGARVGPADFCFRGGADVIPGRDLPAGFAAVLAGHIHRHQVLTHDLRGRPLAMPVFYPGSVERTSTAERDEPKGSLMLEVAPDRSAGGRIRRWSFRPLPTRPMVTAEITPGHRDLGDVEHQLSGLFAGAPDDGIIHLAVRGPLKPMLAPIFRAGRLQALSGPNQIVELRFPDRRRAPGSAPPGQKV